MVGVVYRHPVNTAKCINSFNKKFNELLISVKYPYYCIGDLNISLLDISTHDDIRQYANEL